MLSREGVLREAAQIRLPGMSSDGGIDFQGDSERVASLHCSDAGRGARVHGLDKVFKLQAEGFST